METWTVMWEGDEARIRRQARLWPCLPTVRSTLLRAIFTYRMAGGCTSRRLTPCGLCVRFPLSCTWCLPGRRALRGYSHPVHWTLDVSQPSLCLSANVVSQVLQMYLKSMQKKVKEVKTCSWLCPLGAPDRTEVFNTKRHLTKPLSYSRTPVVQIPSLAFERR